MAAVSKYVRNSVEVVSPKVKNGEDTALLNELLKYKGKCEQKPVLFPTDDYTASVMDSNRNVLSEIFIMPGIVGAEQGVMTETMNKDVQAEIAKAVGVPVPAQWIVSLSGGFEIPEDMVYPCFVKPLESITGYKKEMGACNDELELRMHLDNLARAYEDRSVLVQEFLDIDNEIDISGVCLDQKVVIPAIIRKTDVAEYEKGVTMAGALYPFEELGELCDKIVAMMKSLHYVGMFDLELNIAGGRILFNEINFRSGGPNFSYFMSGVNLPALVVTELLGRGHSPEDEMVDEYGKSFIYEKVAWDDYLNGYLTKAQLDAKLAAADIRLLINDDDPKPGKVLMKELRNKSRIQKLKTHYRKVMDWFFGPIEGRNLPQEKSENRRNAASELPRVLVSGRNYCSNLTMARALGEAGYEVEILRIYQKEPRHRNPVKRMQPDARSKYVKAFHVCVSNRMTSEIVQALLDLADENRKMLLIPVDDLVTSIADEFYDVLSEHYIIPNIGDTAGAISSFMSKDVQKDAAIAAGLPVLGSCVIKTEGGEFDIPETVKYPCFVKPNISKNSSKSQMCKCESREELEMALKERSQKKDIEMLVEDFADIRKEYSILGISTKKGAIGPALFVAVEGGQKEHRGVALIGKTLPVSEMQELVDKCVKFVGELDFDGLFDIDLIETADGKLYFVELNLRFGASGYAFVKSGINLPGMFADYMLQNIPVDMNAANHETGKTFVSERVLIDEYMNNRITNRQLKKFFKQVDIHFIQDDDDPAGYECFRKFYKYAMLLRPFYRIKARAELAKQFEQAEIEGTN